MMTKIEALEYLIKHEIHWNEWQGAAMYLKCKDLILSTKVFFDKYELDDMLESVKNS